MSFIVREYKEYTIKASFTGKGWAWSLWQKKDSSTVHLDGKADYQMCMEAVGDAATVLATRLENEFQTLMSVNRFVQETFVHCGLVPPSVMLQNLSEERLRIFTEAYTKAISDSMTVSPPNKEKI